MNAGDNGISGYLFLSTGTSSGGNSGYVALETGTATSGRGGAFTILVGDGDSGDGGSVSLAAGGTSADGTDGRISRGGTVTIVAGHGAGEEFSMGGAFSVSAGIGGSDTGGSVFIKSGYGSTSTSGSITTSTMNGGEMGASGRVEFTTGSSSSGNTGSVLIATGTADIEYAFPFMPPGEHGELEGIAHRGDFDLRSHMEGKLDPNTNPLEVETNEHGQPKWRGSGKDLFEIDENSGIITTINTDDKDRFDYEVQPNEYDVWVIATDPDGLTDDVNVVIRIDDINEAPRLTTTGFGVAENLSKGKKGQLISDCNCNYFKKALNRRVFKEHQKFILWVYENVLRKDRGLDVLYYNALSQFKVVKIKEDEKDKLGNLLLVHNEQMDLSEKDFFKSLSLLNQQKEIVELIGGEEQWTKKMRKQRHQKIRAVIYRKFK